MLQCGLFDKPAPTPVAVLDCDPDGLRPYQREAVTAITDELGAHRSTLLVMATGLGKTQVFGAVAKHWPGRVLVLAHRDELVHQAAVRLRQMTGGEGVAVEKAESYSGDERLVVASVQTFANAERHGRYTPEHFGLLVVDEAHHAVATTYARILDHFSDARVLGVTATPDRSDELALGKVFASVAYRMDIHTGMAGGFLVPIVAQSVYVSGINLSAVHTVAGDLNQGELDAVMATEENLHAVARPLLDLAGERQSLVYTTSVANAHRMAEILNRAAYRPGCARAVDGTTEMWERRATLEGHRRSEFQFLVNVGVLTEGVDAPYVACIAMARPTKSRALYTQCVGRGLRPAPGKRDCLLLDFVGNSGKHVLVGPTDLLGGRYDDDVRSRARKLLAAAGRNRDAQEVLAEAELQVRREREKAELKRRSTVSATVKYQVGTSDPLSVFGLKLAVGGSWGQGPPSQREVELLARFRVDLPPGCTRVQARRLLDECFRRLKQHLCTYRQAKALARFGYDTQNMPMATASALLDALARNGWRALSPLESERLLHREREPGEDG